MKTSDNITDAPAKSEPSPASNPNGAPVGRIEGLARRYRELVASVLLISIVCTALLAVLGPNVGQAMSGATPGNAVVVQDVGFSSPRLALAHLLQGISSGNFYAGAQACATTSLAEHYNWKAEQAEYQEWLAEDYWPSEYAYWREANATSALYLCVSAMRDIAGRLSGLPTSDLTESIQTRDPETLLGQLNPATLGALRMTRYDPVGTAGLALKGQRLQCGWEGAQQCTSGLALLDVHGSYWLIGPSFVKYSTGWQIDQIQGLAGDLAGVTANAPIPVTQATYAAALAKVRHAATT